MKNPYLPYLFVLFLFLLCHPTTFAQESLRASEVNHLIGLYDGANTLPGGWYPWGMTSAVPQLSDESSIVAYTGQDFYGVGHLNLSGVGCRDGSFFVVRPLEREHASTPWLGGSPTNKWKLAQSAGYYALILPPATVEMSSLERVSAVRMSIPGVSAPRVSLRATPSFYPLDSGYIRRVGPRLFVAGVYSGDFCRAAAKRWVYAAIETSEEPVRVDMWEGRIMSAAESAAGDSAACVLHFADQGVDTAVVEVRTALSFVSEQNAILNLTGGRFADLDFDSLRSRSDEAWEAVFAPFSFYGIHWTERSKIATALLRSCLHPSISEDYNGEYRAADGSVQSVAAGRHHYTVFSLWDTYRTLHPFLSLFFPDRQTDMAESALDHAFRTGALPRWELWGHDTKTMNGVPGLVMLADSWKRGIKMREDAYDFIAARYAVPVASFPVREDFEDYDRYGFIPSESYQVVDVVSATLENYHADYALACWALDLGDMDVASAAFRRVNSWRTMFDTAGALLVPCSRSGQRTYIPSERWGDILPYYTEGTAEEYSLGLPWTDVALRSDVLRQRARVLMERKLLTPGIGLNQQTLHIPFLGVRHAGGDTIRAVLDSVSSAFYPGMRIPGNDDTGTLSSWFLWTRLGLYPDVAGTGRFVVFPPVGDSVVLTLPGRDEPLVIRNTSRGKFSRLVRVDGAVVSHPALSHRRVAEASLIEWERSDSAGESFLRWLQVPEITSVDFVGDNLLVEWDGALFDGARWGVRVVDAGGALLTDTAVDRNSLVLPKSSSRRYILARAEFGGQAGEVAFKEILPFSDTGVGDSADAGVELVREGEYLYVQGIGAGISIEVHDVLGRKIVESMSVMASGARIFTGAPRGMLFVTIAHRGRVVLRKVLY